MAEHLFLVGYRDGPLVRTGLEMNGTLHALDDSLSSFDRLLQTVPAGELIPRLLTARGEPVRPRVRWSVFARQPAGGLGRGCYLQTQ